MRDLQERELLGELRKASGDSSSEAGQAPRAGDVSSFYATPKGCMSKRQRPGERERGGQGGHSLCPSPGGGPPTPRARLGGGAHQTLKLEAWGQRGTDLVNIKSAVLWDSK